MKIDKSEMHKNDNILHNEYNEYKIQRSIALTKLNSNNLNNKLNSKLNSNSLGSPPTIINKYGKLINIGKNNKNFSCPTISEILNYNNDINNSNYNNNISIDDIIKEEATPNKPENTLFEVVNKDLMDINAYDLNAFDINTFDINTYDTDY